MFTNKKSLLALSIASVFALSGCFSDDDGNDYAPPGPGPDPEVVVPPGKTADIGAVAYGNVVDIITKDVVPDATVMFFESGSEATNIVDVDGEPTPSVEATDGNFIFQLDDSSVTEVTAIVTAKNYISKSFVIDLNNLSNGDVAVEFALTANSADGVAVAEVTAEDLVSGSSATPIVAEAVNGEAAAKVTVPAGTVLRDAAGDAITGDSVKVNVISADANSTSAAAIAPEGLNSATSSTIKVPAGVASIEMVDSNDVKVKSFSNPIQIEMAVKDATTAPLDLSSHSEDSGLWSEETGTTVALTGTTASFDIDHLTFFATTKDFAACSTGVNLVLDGEVPASGLFSVLTSTDGYGRIYIPGGEDTASAQYVPGVYDGATARVTVSDFEGNLWFDSVQEVSVCGDVNVALETEAEYVSETLALTAACSQDESVTAPASGALVTYSREGKATKVAKGNGNGEYALNDLISGKSYTVNVTYRGTLDEIGMKSYTITADGTDEPQVETLTCDISTGGTGGTGGN